MKALQQVLDSGDFTIIYWDNGIASLYEKKWDKDEEFKRDDYKTLDKFLIEEFDTEDMIGYCPKLVALLTRQIGGITDSI